MKLLSNDISSSKVEFICCAHPKASILLSLSPIATIYRISRLHGFQSQQPNSTCFQVALTLLLNCYLVGCSFFFFFLNHHGGGGLGRTPTSRINQIMNETVGCT